MRKIIIPGLCIICIFFVLSACQKTPEEAAVVDRSGGLSEDNILPKEKDTPKNLEVPDHWQETLEEGDGFITLEADYDIVLPEVYNTPVVSYKITPVNNEMLRELCEYFADGDQLYEYRAMTKGELNIEKGKMENREGEWAYYDYSSLQNSITEMENLISKASEEKAKKIPVVPKLTVPQRIEEEYVRKNYIGGYWYPWYYDTDQKIGFLARIDRGEVCDPMIRALTYDKNMGSTSAFLYRQGTYIDEKELTEDKSGKAPLAVGNGYLEYLNGLETRLDQTSPNDFSEEDARKKIDEVLGELKIKGMEVTDCVRAIGSPDTESWSGLTDDNLEWETGYSIYLSPKVGDVVGYTLPRAIQYSDLPETSYAPPFFTEQLHIVVTKEGICMFEWMYLSEKEDMIAENTKLLSFNEIKEKLMEHLQYAELSTEGGEIPTNTSYVYKVTGVQLRAANVNAYEDPDSAWMVPVWVFEMNRTGVYKYEGEQSESNLGTTVVILNAIDGGYVTTP